MSTWKTAVLVAIASLRAGLVIVALAGCAEPGEPTSVVEPGRIEFHDSPAKVSVPAGGSVGEPVTIEVRTYGGGCIDFGSTEVELHDDGADVLPYDRRQVGDDLICTLELRELPHVVTVEFDAAGSKTLRIHGRRVTRSVDEMITVAALLQIE